MSRARTLARVAVAVVLLAVAVLVVAAATAGPLLLLATWLAVPLVLVAGWFALARRGRLRAVSLAVVALAPVLVGWGLVVEGLAAPLLVALALLAGSWVLAQLALSSATEPVAMPEHAAPAPRRPYLVMNPRSGGGKVRAFSLPEMAAELGAEVTVLDGHSSQDVAQLARAAAARGADLLGVAGGDGTVAAVAGVAAELGLPFLVVSAGTHNHFALDLGLDRDDPSSCLLALTDDAVEVHVDLGRVGDRPFVNNASFGAYADLVRQPAYRHDKAHTTVSMLHDVFSGQARSDLCLCTEDVRVSAPTAVLVSANPYGLGDLAGMGLRPRLDTGRLGVVAVTATSARQALGLLWRRPEQRMTTTTASEVSVGSSASVVPVAVDGEPLLLPAPVRCTLAPQALRVRVPRHRPGAPRRPLRWDWVALVRLATRSAPSPRREEMMG